VLLVRKALKVLEDQTEVLVPGSQVQRDHEDLKGTLDHQDLSVQEAALDQLERQAAVVFRAR